jgi:Domain of unknown function (DUF6968)
MASFWSRTPRGAAVLIAYRRLIITGRSGDTEVSVRLFQPEIDEGMWICRYEIDWPSQKRSHFAGGADSFQALILALQMIGAGVASSASAPKPAKPAPATAARRTQTSEPGLSAEPKRRGGEPLAIQPPIVAANPAPRPAAQSVPAAASRDESATWNGDEGRLLLARLKQVPSWFLPENDRLFGDLPRPPLPVGESLRSAM